LARWGVLFDPLSDRLKQPIAPKKCVGDTNQWLEFDRMAKKRHEHLRPYFDRHSDRLDAALRAALAHPIPMELGRRLQFEVCPYFYRVVLTDTEEEILPDGWLDLPGEVLELVEEAGGESPEAETEFLVAWLAHGWARVGGPRQAGQRGCLLLRLAIAQELICDLRQIHIYPIRLAQFEAEQRLIEKMGESRNLLFNRIRFAIVNKVY